MFCSSEKDESYKLESCLHFIKVKDQETDVNIRSLILEDWMVTLGGHNLTKRMDLKKFPETGSRVGTGCPVVDLVGDYKSSKLKVN